MFAEVFLSAQSIDSIIKGRAFFDVVVMLLMFMVLTAALWVLLINIFGEVVRGCLPRCGHNLFDSIDAYTGSFVNTVAFGLFGLKKGARATTGMMSDDMEDSTEEEWTGRIAYMERSIQKMLKEELPGGTAS